MIYDWNEARRSEPPIGRGFDVVDETLRDGIQSPSVNNPTIEEKLELLHLMVQCGVDCVDVGLPGAGAGAVADSARLVREIVDQKLDIVPNCAARTHLNDVAAVAKVSQLSGRTVECCAFLGSSPIRRLIEGWDVEKMVGLVSAAGQLCREEGLPFSFVTEDTTRSDPETLDTLFRAAIYNGASRLVLCDTVGHATPDGLANLVEFARGVIASTGADVKIDWHGHNDRGLSLTLALSALELGLDRVHGTCMGVGERVGNTPLDLLLINLRLLRVRDRELNSLGDYVRKVSEYYGVDIPRAYPVFGDDAFRTATGVHAAAIVKALARGREDLADAVYSSVPAGDYGCKQHIDVGYYSGKANVHCWLNERGMEITEARVQAVLIEAKKGRATLSDATIHQIISAVG